MHTHNTVAARPVEAEWARLIPDEQWDVFCRGASALRAAGVRFMLGGALALATYTQRWRNTKDVDVILCASDKDTAVRAVRDAGFEDYFDRESYDRSWIFRGFRDGVLFDVIWELPNHRVDIDDAWFERATPLTMRGDLYSTVPAEELIRIKLYVMQRERCDWVDVLNVLASACDRLDWPWLVQRMGRDLPLLHGVLAVFTWLCPGRAACMPGWVHEQFALTPETPPDPVAMELRRVRLFDSRPWFAPHQEGDRPLER